MPEWAIRTWLVRGLFTLVLLAGVAVLGQLPMGRSSEIAVIRVAIRFTQARVELCRQRTAEELAALPAHMREPEICESRAPRYELELRLDGESLLLTEVHPGGLRADRPLIVDRQVHVAPGPARLGVRFSSISEIDEDDPFAAAFAALPDYRLDREIVLEADRITLVQLDEARGLAIYGE